MIITPLLRPVAVTCPSCAVTLLTVSATGETTPDNEPWLHDGDMVPGVVDGRTRRPLRDAMLFVGRCAACSASYYVCEGKWLDAEAGEDADECLVQPQDVDGRYSLATAAAPTAAWFLFEQHTAAGLLHTWWTGPLALPDTTGVVGSAGVSACGANGGAQASPWTRARELLQALNNDAEQHLAARVAAAAAQPQAQPQP